ncbi:MAG: hypothetical protein LCH56_11090 [Proteobacteria bacterium]|nr:hypothetical protein [Pseudomonadota bacterium]
MQYFYDPIWSGIGALFFAATAIFSILFRDTIRKERGFLVHALLTTALALLALVSAGIWAVEKYEPRPQLIVTDDEIACRTWAHAIRYDVISAISLEKSGRSLAIYITSASILDEDFGRARLTNGQVYCRLSSLGTDENVIFKDIETRWKARRS